jgi:hypothetical protein
MQIERREFLRSAAVLGPTILVLGGDDIAAACDVGGKIEHAPKPVLPALRYVTKVVRRVTPTGVGYNEVLSLPA